MTELAFQFETDPQMGIPRLLPVLGASVAWSAKDVQQVEDQLRARYDALVRDGQGTVDHKGKTLVVRKKAGDTSRQPTLEIHVPVSTSMTATSSLPLAHAPTSAGRSEWFTGWLDEVERLVTVDRVLPAERAMLALVRDELRAIAEKGASRELALLLFVAVTSLADRLSRTHKPGEPHPYPFALSGLERLFSAEAATPWGPVRPGPNSEPPPTWFGRFWNLLKGE